ncbi:MAG: hypothetical protein K9H49_02650 [Bacteroidales bacterium]|nr:hypothetical protein [Bacteroidales bacterium]MCF8389157.1 hypothetical protein [Bacteroidales bacterium]
MKLLNIIVILFICNLHMKAQPQITEENKSQISEEKNYDYLNHNYNYLDENYKIIISNEKFNELLKVYELIPEQVQTYKDSLSVVLCGEFDKWSQRNRAQFRITYTWLRAGYHLWLTEAEAEKMGQKYGIKMPYQLSDYARHPELWNDEMKDFMKNLRARIYDETKNEAINKMDNKQLLNYALLENPDRQKDFEIVQKERSGNSVGCGKPNCCQTKGSTLEKCDDEKK